MIYDNCSIIIKGIEAGLRDNKIRLKLVERMPSHYGIANCDDEE